ncbi:MAG: pyridoxamine 5'-phosphate oxidase family protein [Acidimicrobiia bacterium]|nr:pyridoxamine 5'-phosphate oxidase family protein [Acidimicrobiia bacterium]
MAADRIETLSDLEARYGEPVPTAITKEVARLTPLHRRFIECSPFVVLATAGPDGLDCSPRGDRDAVVRVVDSSTVHLPDRRGNNRIDSLRNLVCDPRVALLFFVPGIGTTLRINGRAQLLVDDDLLASFAVDGRTPATVIEVTAERVYTQCPKALVRSGLWEPDTYRSRDEVPTVGQIMEEITEGELDGAAYDAAYPKRLRDTLY